MSGSTRESSAHWRAGQRAGRPGRGTRLALARFFDQWEQYLADGFARMRASCVLREEADPAKFAVAVMTSLQGLLLTQTRKTTRPSVAPEVQQLQSQALDFVGGNSWLNSQPLSLSALKGKVVLVEFWTYSCINCVNTLPEVRQWRDRYADQGLVVVGVHTPEFAAEHNADHVRAAAERLGVTWPIVLDNDYRIWNAYRNNYGPHLFLIDRRGQIVYHHIGEGAYAETEQRIQQALAAQ